MTLSADSAQPHIATISANGRRYLVSVRISYDGVEYLGRLWFTDEDDPEVRIPDRGCVPGNTREAVLEHAGTLEEEDLRSRFKRAVANKRRYLALRDATDEILLKIRYLNQVVISMRGGLIDLDGAAQEIDLTENQLFELVRRLRAVAGVEETDE